MIEPIPSSVLALDLGSALGWAHHSHGIYSCGTNTFARKHGRKTIPDDHLGKKFHDLDQWLSKMIRDYKPEALAYEEPMGVFKNASVTHLIIGFRGVMMATAAKFDLPIHGIPQSALKMFATGKGNADKPLMLSTATRHFQGKAIPENDNEADALFILQWYLEKKAKEGG